MAPGSLDLNKNTHIHSHVMTCHSLTTGSTLCGFSSLSQPPFLALLYTVSNYCHPPPRLSAVAMVPCDETAPRHVPNCPHIKCGESSINGCLKGRAVLFGSEFSCKQLETKSLSSSRAVMCTHLCPCVLRLQVNPPRRSHLL